ncbi:hypothetical protein JXI42_01855 [bacterium]|nr:hypothetical protein [bacterium]
MQKNLFHIIQYCILFLSLTTAFSTAGAENSKPIKCLTHELLSNYRALKSHAMMYRPDYLPEVYVTEHFKIWYTLVGDNAPDCTDMGADSIPIWIIDASNILEWCWDSEVIALGYRAPLPDSSSVEGARDVGGDDRTDVYIENVRLGTNPAFGLTVPEYIIEEDGEIKATAFMKIENDYAEEAFDDYRGREIEALMVTCAHEFFHTIHFSYHFPSTDPPNNTFDELYWWYEASAVYMEDQVYDDVNDYVNYLPSFFNYPEYSLRSQRGAHLYGACIFTIFLSEYFDYSPYESHISLGDTIIREIWDTMATVQHSFESIDLILQKHGTNMEEVFQTFTVWNLFTGEDHTYGFYSEGVLYPTYSEGDLYPTVAYEEIEFSDLDTVVQFAPPVSDSFACTYYRINTEVTEEGLGISFEPSLSYNGAFSAAAIGAERTDQRDTVIIYPKDTTEAAIPGVWRFSKIYALTQLFDPTDEDPSCNITLTRDENSAVPLPSNASFGKPYPNPFTPPEEEWALSYHFELKFPFTLNTTSDVSLFIYTSSGDLVYKTREIALYPGTYSYSNALRWDGKNQSGKLVSDGIYIYKIVAGNEDATGKIAVIR